MRAIFCTRSVNVEQRKIKRHLNAEVTRKVQDELATRVVA